MLDRTKMPPNLWAHRLWVPNAGSDRGARTIAYVTERRRRMVGGVILVLGFVLVLAMPLAHAPVGLLMVGLVMSVVGGVYAAGGRSGFYEVAEDGSLGEFLGRSKPELGSMRGMKVS
jgi:hypothetical protein